jgi:beta-glucanase (GH16 family)
MFGRNVAKKFRGKGRSLVEATNLPGMIIRRGLLIAAAALMMATNAPAQATNAWTGGCAGVSANTVGNVTWTPALCQEFNSTTAGPPEAAPWSTWSYDLGSSGFGNNEAETYCGPPGYPDNPADCPAAFDPATANSYVDGKGHLVIQIVNNNSGTWNSARMTTQNTQAFQYGRIEASAELPDLSIPGLWPAFWWLGTDIATVSWPACGESDIMEAWADSTACGPPAGNTTNHSTLHYGTSSASLQSNAGTYTFPGGEQMNTAFYAYGVIWSANMLQYYVNTPTPSSPATSTVQPFLIVTASDAKAGESWRFNVVNPNAGPVFLLLNVAVGGTCGGSLPSGTGPYRMLVDYVREYEPSATPAPEMGNPPAISLTAGAKSGNTSVFTPTLAPHSGYVYFSCDTTAPNATCSIKTSDPLDRYVVNSDAILPEAVIVSVATTAKSALPPASLDWKGTLQRLPFLAIGMVILLSVMARKKVWQGSSPASDACFAMLVLLATLMMACGSGGAMSGGGNGGGNNTAATPPGNYTITVYAFTQSNTSNGANSNADAKISIPLTVR